MVYVLAWAVILRVIAMKIKQETRKRHSVVVLLSVLISSKTNAKSAPDTLIKVIVVVLGIKKSTVCVKQLSNKRNSVSLHF